MAKSEISLTDPEKNRKVFSERLGSLLPNRGDVKTLSEKTGISITAIRQWLRGEAEPSRDRLVLIADALGVSLAWLATGQGQKEPMPEGQEALDYRKTGINTALFARIAAEVDRLFIEEKVAVTKARIGEEAGRILALVDDLDGIDGAEDALARAISIEINRLRRQIRVGMV